MRWLRRAESEVLVCWGLARDARGRQCQGDPRLIIQPLAGQVTARGGRGGDMCPSSPPCLGRLCGEEMSLPCWVNLLPDDVPGPYCS